MVPAEVVVQLQKRGEEKGKEEEKGDESIREESWRG